jgi:hypothetical protein
VEARLKRVPPTAHSRGGGPRTRPHDRQRIDNVVVTALRYRLRSFAWLALLAMAALALGPTISRALAPAGMGAAGAHEHHMEMGAHASALPCGHAEAGHRSGAPVDSSCVLGCCPLCAVAASAFTIVAAFVPPSLPLAATEPPRQTVRASGPRGARSGRAQRHAARLRGPDPHHPSRSPSARLAVPSESPEIKFIENNMLGHF